AMSGTSTDGVDVAALQVDSSVRSMRFLDVVSIPFESPLQQALLSLQQIPPQFPSGSDPLGLFLQARRQLTEMYAIAVGDLLSLLGLEPGDVAVLGAHGQTLRHRPDLGYTYQMLDGALLASRTGIDVVHDFRSMDVALGGQGAPLVPAFHQAWLNSRGIHGGAAVLNLGGFSNMTVLNGAGSPVTGGDCGPANVLMDNWAQTRFGQRMDFGGDIAASGSINETLMDLFWAHPFFRQSWPKSTGRDDFSSSWFNECLAKAGRVSPEDVMTTLLSLTVRAVQSCLPADVEQLYVCGGGAKNASLLAQLACECAPVEVLPVENLALPAEAVEAAAFAWLAARFLEGLPGNCPSVTGASRLAVLGALHRAG
ncbi:MAG TPA: anhydro-N-acetylmuramic acid kinase, partial [Limnobacter sp.]|nr:anhydro-N-acetylmuramic acid kinase [Limnobacter sp.]